MGGGRGEVKKVSKRHSPRFIARNETPSPRVIARNEANSAQDNQRTAKPMETLHPPAGNHEAFYPNAARRRDCFEAVCKQPASQ